MAEGARVVIADILDEEGNALADELGEAAAYVHLDVTDRAQWADAVATTVERFGSLNVLVNNAGIANFAPIGEYTGEQWDTLIGINLTGVFNGMTASVDALKAGAPSSIINISSTAGLQGFASLPGYSAAKHGLVGLSKSAALDLGADNVRANTVHPGVIATPMTDGMETPQTHVAMKRVGQPEEVSAMIVFLASDESSFSTGAEFVADGGETAGLAPSE